MNGSTPQDLLSELDELARTPKQCRKGLPGYVTEPVLRRVLVVEEPSKRLRSIAAPGLHLLDQARCLSMVLSSRTDAERLTAGGVSRRDPGEDRERSGDVRRGRDLPLAGRQLRDLEELPRVVEARPSVAG